MTYMRIAPPLTDLSDLPQVAPADPEVSHLCTVHYERRLDPDDATTARAGTDHGRCVVTDAQSDLVHTICCVYVADYRYMYTFSVTNHSVIYSNISTIHCVVTR